jgi:hypothetical protein
MPTEKKRHHEPKASYHPGLKPANVVNQSCHGLTVKVTNQGADTTARSFTLVPIFWGDIYQTHPGTDLMRTFLLDLSSYWMEGLAQYNVDKLWIYPENITISPAIVYPSPVPTTVPQADIENALKVWCQSDTFPAPQANNWSIGQPVCYIIFMAPTVTATLGGFHASTTFNQNTQNDDLWYAVVYSNGLISADQTAVTFVNNLSPLTSHELSEMLTNPYGQDWFAEASDGSWCEVADICECSDGPCSTGLVTVSYTAQSGNTWTIEKYWSNADNACKNPNDYVPVTPPGPSPRPGPFPDPFPSPRPHGPVMQDEPREPGKHKPKYAPGTEPKLEPPAGKE